MPGFAHGFHEGSRSEYLAAYVFSSFGTASAIPHQEDHGFDLYCTLSKRDGRVAWADKPYSVQVKSNYDPWEFKNPKSIEWFIRHPLPLFLCVVDKERNQLSLYQTTPKFYYWTINQPFPEHLNLFPQKNVVDGKCKYWQDPGVADLSAPIAEFTLDQLSNDEFFLKIQSVLNGWLTIEYENLFQITAGVRRWISPSAYKTNEPVSETLTATVLLSGHANTSDELQNVISRLRHSIAWIMDESSRLGDLKGAVRAALFLRHFFRDEPPYDVATFCAKLHRALGVANPTYMYASLDTIAASIDDELPHYDSA